MIDQEVQFPAGGAELAGHLTVPDGAPGVVLFAHGSGSSRFSPRNGYVAGVIRAAGVGTLLFDLLTREEEREDMRTGALRFDIGFLGTRLLGALRWLAAQPFVAGLRLGYFGSSTGGAAALVAAAQWPEPVGAVVCRGSRTDLAETVIDRVRAPVLLIVGGDDVPVLEMNEHSFALIRAEKRLEVIPGASHLFEEPGTLETVARLAAEWFGRKLKAEG